MQERIPQVSVPAPAPTWATEGAAARVSRRSRRSIIMAALLLDGILTWLAFCTAYDLRYVARWAPIGRDTLPVPLTSWMPCGILFTVLVLVSLAASGLYETRLGRDLLDEVGFIVRAATVAVGLVVIVSTFIPTIEYSRLVIVYAWLALIPYLACGRAALYGVLVRIHSREWNVRRVVVAGTTPLSRMVLQRLITRRGHGYHLVGFLHETTLGASTGSATKLSLRRDFGRFKCLGGVDDLPQVLRDWQIEEVIVALPAHAHADITALYAQCEQAGVTVKLVPDLYELSLSRVRMDHLAGIPLIDVRRPGQNAGALVVKRALDLGIAGLALILVAPLLLLTAIAIKLDSPGPVMANQRRVGKDGKHFTFYKFRSMFVGAEQQQEALAQQQGLDGARIFKDRNDPRRTHVGRLIRRLSIDELPQLVNVLRGDMTLVGPRPPLPSEVARYEPHHLKRLQVPGGITGLWQVSGRSNIESFEEIVIMDTYYIDNWSLALDLRILVQTVVAVLARTGAY